MSDLKICRICVGTEVKMYHLGQHSLSRFYEGIVHEIVSQDLPQYVCFECTALLYKFYIFKEKCLLGLRTLQNLWSKGMLSYKNISKIDRNSTNLASSLSIKTITESIIIYYKETNREQRKKKRNVKDRFNKHSKRKVSNIKGNIEIIEVPIKEENENANFIDTEEKAIDKESQNVYIDKVKPETNTSDVSLDFYSGDVPDNIQNSDDTDSEIPLNLLKCKDNKVKNDEKLKQKSVKRKRDKIRVHKFKMKLERRKGRPSKEADIFGDPERWKVVKLTKEEAMAEFRQKDQDERYIKAEHKCKECFKFFLTAQKLSRHMKFRHSELSGAEECSFCKVRYKLPNQLTKHTQCHFMKYTCVRCNFVCSLKNTAFYHDETHKGLHKTCQHCGKQFRHTSTYYTHLRVAHKWSFTCLRCGAQFINQVGLRMHNQRMHFDKEDLKSNKEEIYCDKCDMNFESTAAYDQHFVGSSNHPEKHRLSHNSGVRLRKKPSKCHQCGKCFDTQAEYFSHHRKTHPGTSMYDYSVVCEICGASIKPGSVKAHSNSHTKERLFPCETCGRQFTTLNVMKAHLLTHTGEKPHQCTLCEKRFTQRGSMMLHFKTFHLKQPYPKRNRNKKIYIETAGVFGHREK